MTEITSPAVFLHLGLLQRKKLHFLFVFSYVNVPMSSCCFWIKGPTAEIGPVKQHQNEWGSMQPGNFYLPQGSGRGEAHLRAVQCPAPLLVDILAMASFHRSGGAVQIQSLQDIHAELLLG